MGIQESGSMERTRGISSTVDFNYVTAANCIKQALLKIKTDPSISGLGLCPVISDTFDSLKLNTLSEDYAYKCESMVRDLFMSLCETWEHYSGDTAFPVPAVHRSYPFDEYYFDMRSNFNKATVYGELRWELLEHILKMLENIEDSTL